MSKVHLPLSCNHHLDTPNSKKVRGFNPKRRKPRYSITNQKKNCYEKGND